MTSKDFNTHKAGFNNSQMQRYREKKGDLDISSENEQFWIDEDSDKEYQKHCDELLTPEQDLINAIDKIGGPF